MKFQPLRASIVRLRCHWTKLFMAREPKKAIPEKTALLEHLARKVAVLLDTEEPMVEQLQAHDQLDLLYDMEQPLAAVLAKMEIAGIKVERQTLEDMQVENEVVLERLTQEIYELGRRRV